MKNTVDCYEAGILAHDHLGGAICWVTLFAGVGDLLEEGVSNGGPTIEALSHTKADSLELLDLALSLLETLEAYQGNQLSAQGTAKCKVKRRTHLSSLIFRE